ncbi:MAG: hydroxylamine reductase [Clostridia bacterium]|uniref:Hydroxylamine reductase n=1 Tax=Thermacetogenium phaeum TaxID=85874 RepID=A0A101FFF4_9THEO|nr:MAG: Hydroxylamine reductase [Thermacetogenium phaeum]MDK2880424.1 hydroxylamine reductase [Clostridia bacterium]MDN5365000.1 hydroxylamine reductase [Thermacetogenium sp.]
MFCYQCEQTAGGTGCTKSGVCGKNEDLAGLQDTLLIALKGIAAYAYHARELGFSDAEVDAFITEALFATLTNVNFNLESHLALLLKAGEINLRVMKLLDQAHTERFGTPEPTEVMVGTKAGPGILVTGHDILDLYELLRQTEGKGINVYTHGEMLPALAYPELKKFPHLVGNYGTAWQNQRKEFEEFSGAILGTTNCVLLPRESYKDRLFTCGVADLPGVIHIQGRNFAPVIEKALKLPPLPDKRVAQTVTGFHHQVVLGLADKVIAAVKAGKIRHFFLVGGCDGIKQARSYYTEFVRKLPKDCVIITLGCGKFRFNYLDLGEIEGIPRLLDMGQCNNAYSAIQVALALAEAFNCGVNELPLSLVLSWFEQKAVAILLTLLHLGIKNIRIGPSLPAFITPNVLKMLQEQFSIQPISTPEEDIKAILG